MAARQLRRFSLLLLLLAFLPEGTLGAALAKAKPKKAKPKKKPAASSGGGFGAVAPKAAQASLLQPPQWKQAVQTKGAMLVAAPEDPQLWLEMGALLVKGREYAEAERVFRLGAITHPDFEYLSAAALTMGGDSEAYWHGQAVSLKPGPRVDAPAFDSFDAPAEALDAWDQVCSRSAVRYWNVIGIGLGGRVGRGRSGGRGQGVGACGCGWVHPPPPPTRERWVQACTTCAAERARACGRGRARRHVQWCVFRGACAAFGSGACTRAVVCCERAVRARVRWRVRWHPPRRPAAHGLG